MTLIICPECGHETSPQAAACPNCGRPLHAPKPVVEETVVVPRPTAPKENGFPTWAFIPIGLLAVILLIVLYMAVRQNDDQANTNLNVNLARRNSTEPIRSTTSDVPMSTDTTTDVPSGQTTTVPGTSTSAPVPPPPTKGSAVIKASILPPRGEVQSGKNIKFYLLDKDLNSILSEARIPPIEGNTLAASLGLAAVYPDRYGDFQKAAIKAIADHVKYSGTTGNDGTANLSNIEPNDYYLYGITRVGRGFALWSSQVSIITGENVLNLSPQNIVEVPDLPVGRQ